MALTENDKPTEGQPAQPDKPTGAGDPAPSEGQPGPVPYDRFRDVNERLKATEAKLAAIEAERKTAEEKQLADQQKWQELAEKREAELNAERQNRLRLEVATAKGLPFELATRLQGDTQEALEADADKMLQFLKPASGPGVPPAGKKQQSNKLDLSNMTPAQIRENSTKIIQQES